MNTLLKDYQDAKAELISVENAKNKLSTETATSIRAIKDNYAERIEKLENLRDSAIDKLEQSKQNAMVALDEKEKAACTIIENVKDIFSMMYHIELGALTVEPPKIYTISNYDKNGKYTSTHREILYSPIATLLEDDYSKVYLYIVPNKKPTNKYSLMIAGNSPLLNVLERTPRFYDYGIQAQNRHSNIKQCIKDAPSEEVLRTYAEKNLQKIKDSLPHDIIKRCITKYEAAKVYYRDDQWKLAYLNYRKYYYEERVSRGTADPEYKKILSKIKELSKKLEAL